MYTRVEHVLLAEKDYIQAEKLLDRPIFNKSTDAFFRGKVYFEKGDCKKAIESFKETITCSTRDDDDTQVSYHYLLACYAKIKDLGEIKDIIENAKLCHQEFTVFYPIDYRYEDFVEKTLKELLKLKLDDLLKIRIRGLLAFVQTSNLPTPTDDDGEEKPLRALTKKEKILVGKIEKDIKEVIGYYPDDKLFNAVYSNILYLKKDFDNSFRHKLRGIEGISSSQTFFSLWVKMSDVSEDFLSNYSDIVKDVIENYGVSVYDYIEHQFNEDIGALYEKKRFTQIKKLYGIEN
jgi:tetratricopeptide (TPR) repeat protein